MRLQIICACLFAVSYANMCPPQKPVDNFNVTRYAGLWFERKENVTSLKLGNMKCAELNITTYPNNAPASLKRKGFKKNDKSKYILRSYNGLAVPIANNPGEFSVIFPNYFGPSFYPYVVLDTDYINYAITYTCSPFLLNTKIEMIHLYTREWNTTSSKYEQAIMNLKNRFYGRPLNLKNTC